MDYNLQIQKLLVQVDKAVTTQDKVNLIRQAISLADSHNDIEWGYDLRLDLMAQSSGILKSTDALPAFAWLLDACDRYADLFDEKNLFWQYKWMIDSAARNSQISVAQIFSIIDDYKVRIERNGYALRSYHGILVTVGFITENEVMVKENLALRDQYERDIISDIPAHDVYDDVLYLLMSKQIDAALEREHDIYSKAKKSHGNIFAIDTCYAEFLTRANRLDKAAEFIARAEETFSHLYKDNYLLVTLSSLIYALSVTNPEKAWHYFELYSHWAPQGEQYDVLIFSINILPLLLNDETRQLNLSADFPFYQSNGQYNVRDIYKYFYETAYKLASEFDERNQNTAFMDQLLPLKK